MPETRGGKPTALAEVVRADRMFAHDANGKPITRSRACECGRRFTQTQLSERFLAICDRHSSRCIALMTQQIPEFFVPVHCPSCERVDLGRAARIAEHTVYPFGDRDAAD